MGRCSTSNERSDPNPTWRIPTAAVGSWASASWAAAASSSTGICPPTGGGLHVAPCTTSTRDGPGGRGEFGIPVVAASAEELVATAGVDIVDIAVPPWVQPEIVALAAAAGRHMLCQKPFALEFETGARMVETAEAAGVLLAVNQQMRWDAGIAASRDLDRPRGASADATEAQIQVSVATGWHLWPWLAAAPAPRDHVPQHPLPRRHALRPGGPGVGHQRARPVPGAGTRPGRDARPRPSSTIADGRQALVAVNHYNQHGTPYARVPLPGHARAPSRGPSACCTTTRMAGRTRCPCIATARGAASFDFDTRWIPDAFLGPMTDLMDAIATGRAPVTSGRDNLGTLALVFGAYRSAAERRSIRVEDVLLSG